ncbi:MAG: RecB family exonuclease [Acidobacteriota bacterium]
MAEIYSHSRLSTFETCPRQYRFRYVDHLPVIGVGIEAHMGRSVHAALEQLYTRCIAGEVPELATVVGWFESAWHHRPGGPLRIVRRGFDEGDYLDLGRHVLAGYYRRFHPFDQGETVGIEKKIEIRLASGGGIQLIGYIDRVVRTADGGWEIHDYKTSGSLPYGPALDRDRQLTLYEIGLRTAQPDIGRVTQIWHYLTFGRTFTRRRRAADRERVERDVAGVVERIGRESTFAARPGVLCHWCDYRANCAEGEEFIAARQPPGLPDPERGRRVPAGTPAAAAPEASSAPAHRAGRSRPGPRAGRS